MTTIALPTLSRAAPARMSWGQRSNALVHVSPLSGQVQTVELPGARWLLSLEWPPLQEADAGIWESFLASLRGQANRFTAYDFLRRQPRGTYRGTLTVSGAIAQGATAVTIAGGGAAQTLLRGDKLSIGGELKMWVQDATANGSGVITGSVEPPFRAAVSNGASVVWDRPTALFMAVEPEWRGERMRGRLSAYALDAIEVFA